MINTLVQVIASIFFLIILTLIAYSIYNQEIITNIHFYDNIQKQTLIIDGVYDFLNGERSLTTLNKLDDNFVELKPSINQSGGAEYSYNFWLYIDKAEFVINNTADYKALILRGSKRQVAYNSKNCLLKTGNKKYVFIKNPLIRIDNKCSKLIIEYNTVTNADALNYDGFDVNCNSPEKKDANMLGVYDLDKYDMNKNYTMITLVLKETSSTEDILYKNVTNCKLYLNGVVVLDRNVNSPYGANGNDSGSTVMKHNKGPLYINPGDIYAKTTTATNGAVNYEKDDRLTATGSKSCMRMANLSYFNYALKPVEIDKLFNAKFNKTEITLIKTLSPTISSKLDPEFTDPKPY